VYDLEQQDPRIDEHETARNAMCGDCAYRRDSPERANSDTVAAYSDQLDSCVDEGRPFWCHDGMRRTIHHRHPDGRTRTDQATDASYDPPIVERRPYRADGSPALLCAGWFTRRLRAIQARTAKVEDAP
jgi:transcription elongation factor Elf1